ncbi:MAG: hypothetical protein IIV44_02695 [Rikenellaceae bacterium]|nr:hypothetical protein [Rikenellaceae bacterium]
MTTRYKFLVTLLTATLCSTTIAMAGDVRFGSNGKLRKASMPVPAFADKPAATMTGDSFIRRADTTDFWTLEDRIVEAVTSGQVPDALRHFRKITFTTPVVDSVEILSRRHKVEIWVLPDYVAIGTNDDYVRMPMGPLAAQRIADALDCTLPTSYLVDRIAEASEGHIDIFPFRPLGSRNCQPIVFQDSNNAINALFKAHGYHFGQFISGLKKDIVITYKIMTLTEYDRNVAIYGWHHPDGRAQQPLFVRHGNFYVDYSHGVRLIYNKVKIDGVEYNIREILQSPELYRLLSDEPMHLTQATYAGKPKWD